MKYTHLEMVQLILSSMDSDSVTNYNDTTESSQVSKILQTVYFDLVNQGHFPEDLVLFNLTETSASTPNRMTLPTNIGSMKWLKYNIETLTSTDQDWLLLQPLSLEDFLFRMHALAEGNAEVETYDLTIGSSTIPIMYRDDKHPEYYTTYDDNSILFDSVDTATETYLRSTKTQGYGRKIQTYTESNSFVPSLDDDQFQLLLQEAKSLAWTELKQTTHPKAEQAARRHKISQQINKKAVRIYKAFDELPYYGRK